MKIEKQQEELIINFGVFEYNTSKMSNILNIPKEEIDKQMKDKSSDLYRLYQKGSDTADYVIDLKLFEMAKSGDIKALEKFERRKSLRNK